MKKTGLLLIPFLLLFFSCQNNQQTAKTEKEPAENEQADTTVVEADHPVPNAGMKDVKPPTDEKKNSATLFHRGLELVQAKQYDEGIDYLTRSLEGDPKNARIYFNRGYAYFSQKEYDKAQADFNTSLHFNPSDTMVLLYSGLAKYYKNDMPGAEKEFSEAIAKSKGFSKAYYNRGLTKGQLKEYKGAVDDFTKAIILDATYSQAYYNRGLANFYNHDTMNACFDWIQANRMGQPEAKKAVDLYCEKWKR